MRFEWDPAKARANPRKHGVSFDEAHSSSEDRFIMLGMGSNARLLVVCHCERSGGDVVRLVSAGRATNYEASFYGGG